MNRYIGYEIKDINNLLTRRIFLMYKNNNKIITPIQYKIIDYLLINEKAYQKDLEKKFNLRRSTISGILKTMEKNNLILKETNNRINEIFLTVDIKKEIKIIKEQMINLETELKKNITNEELENFFIVIDKIKENITEKNL